MSQSELASKAGVALSVLQAIEQNRSDPKLSTILALLDVLKSKGIELLPETGQVAFGLFVTIESEADLTGSIRPNSVSPLVPVGDPDTRDSTSRSTRSKRSKASKPEP